MHAHSCALHSTAVCFQELTPSAGQRTFVSGRGRPRSALHDAREDDANGDGDDAPLPALQRGELEKRRVVVTSSRAALAAKAEQAKRTPDGGRILNEAITAPKLRIVYADGAAASARQWSGVPEPRRYTCACASSAPRMPRRTAGEHKIMTRDEALRSAEAQELDLLMECPVLFPPCRGPAAPCRCALMALAAAAGGPQFRPAGVPVRRPRPHALHAAT